MTSPLFDFQFKLILIGDSMVGKSSLMKAFSEGNFQNPTEPTIGVDFSTRTILIQPENKKIKLQLWDTAGQEKFRSISKNYYRNVVGALVLFDLTKRLTFDHVRDWHSDAIEGIRDENPTVCIVGNKADMKEDRQVNTFEGEMLSQELGASIYFETSAKTKLNVDEVFHKMAKEIYTRVITGGFSHLVNSPDWDGVKKGQTELINFIRTEEENSRSNSSSCCS